MASSLESRPFVLAQTVYFVLVLNGLASPIVQLLTSRFRSQLGKSENANMTGRFFVLSRLGAGDSTSRIHDADLRPPSAVVDGCARKRGSYA